MRLFPIGLMTAAALVALTAPAFAAGEKDAALDPPTAGPLDAASFYKGVWYEQARTPTSLTRGCEYATTEHGHRSWTAQGNLLGNITLGFQFTLFHQIRVLHAVGPPPAGRGQCGHFRLT